jgi:hypothetical protein
LWTNSRFPLAPWRLCVRHHVPAATVSSGKPKCCGPTPDCPPRLRVSACEIASTGRRGGRISNDDIILRFTGRILSLPPAAERGMGTNHRHGRYDRQGRTVRYNRRNTLKSHPGRDRSNHRKPCFLATSLQKQFAGRRGLQGGTCHEGYAFIVAACVS